VPPDEIEDFVESQFRRLLDYTVPVVSLLKGRRITRNIERSFEGRDIEDLWLPYYCVSTNLTTSHLEVHRRGNAAKFVRASVAIPGILPPVPHEGSLLVDGGVLNNLPVTVMRQHGAIGTVIAVDVAPPRGPRSKSEFGGSVSGWRALAASIRPKGLRYPALSTVLLRSMLTGAVHNQREALRGGTVDLLLTMNLPGVGLLEFERTRDVARIGYDSAKVAVDEWAAQQSWMKVTS
jgi:predicted acylesterase/phospholipase RssA